MTAYEDFVTEEGARRRDHHRALPGSSEAPREKFAQWRKRNNR